MDHKNKTPNSWDGDAHPPTIPFASHGGPRAAVHDAGRSTITITVDLRQGIITVVAQEKEDPHDG